ncbi:2-oxoglutarate and Fe(II)-dependent oxygenase superfamily protein isoform 2 [Theobroma cacao]|uniref:2-oxoglutarate and Fe(II)-dependent oxygenase superfamily protein isoform 2 n=1 Tax=Theobroma cacao TaxID=3641 RepID=A0A061EW23_THECC|nr:2-oxoglutarate and Fe(II)-dependent oxygenase superfamily protein isoform 2 [Theobroma cacao]
MAPVPSFPVKVGHIDDVQELRKARPTSIPERFVRDMAERPKHAATLVSASDIPIIDLCKLMKRDKDEHQSEAMQLKTACEEWGFFQVVNHGIDLSVLENIEKVAKDFFMLPLEEKKKYPMAPGTVQGYGQAFVFSENQKLDWCNMFALGVEPPCIRNPKLWPSKPADFRETLEVYSREIRKLCENLLKNIAVSLGLKGDVFEEMFGVAVQAVRMNYYPPCSRPDLVLGLSPHSDGSALTVLQQVLTNGKYKSVEHRAVTHKERDRLSIVTFYAPSYEIELGPMPELVDEKNPCRYRRYNHGEYSKHYVTNKLQGKRALDFAKIESKTSA